MIFFILTLFSINTEGTQIVRLKYDGGGDWYNDPDAIPNLAVEIKKRTNIKIVEEEKILTLMDSELKFYPILFMTGHGNIKLSEEEAKNLREYLEEGGFLYVDDDYGMNEAFQREIKKVFPNSELVELPFDHPIYHIFYNFYNGPPQIHKHYEGTPKGYGLYHQGRMVIYYTYNSNISDGWTEAHNNPPHKREQAFKMGVNIILYGLMF